MAGYALSKWSSYGGCWLSYGGFLTTSDTRFEGCVGGHRIGIGIQDAQQPTTKLQQQTTEPPLQLTHEQQVRQVAVQEEKTYDVRGNEVTTPYNLRLELLEVKGQMLEFTGNASGIFTVSANPLQRARLRTKDLQALCSRGTLFYFDFRPTRFEVRFFDPDDAASPLAVMYADPISPASNPGSGSGKWSSSF